MGGKLEGLVALVTGAASGIGKATAIAFSKEGAKVVVGDIQASVDDVAAEIKSAGGEAVAVVGDVSKETVCKSMVDTAIETFGGLHVAFNNAGIFRPALFAEITEETMDALIDTNIKSLVWGLKYQIPAMAAHAGGNGSIIANTSVSGVHITANWGGGAMYAASKAAAEMLMKHAAIEGAASGVRVNSVVPGMVETSIIDVPREERLVAAGATQLFTRLIQPEEIAKVVVFLASGDSAMVIGSSYVVDGGYTIKA